MADSRRGPRWSQTFTWPWQRVPSDGAPPRPSGFAGCSLRGTAPGLPTRWTTGHWRVDHEGLHFWRHLSRRDSSLVVPLDRLSAADVRKVRATEWLWVNPGCRVLMCTGPDGTVDIALLHRGELEVLRAHLGDPQPMG